MGFFFFSHPIYLAGEAIYFLDNLRKLPGGLAHIFCGGPGCMFSKAAMGSALLAQLPASQHASCQRRGEQKRPSPGWLGPADLRVLSGSYMIEA